MTAHKVSTAAKQKTKGKTASLQHERQYLLYGCRNIVGIDEAGRGAWAGPVAAGAVCLPIERKTLPTELAGVRDSKQMTPRQRANLVSTIKTTATAWGIGSASSAEIDTFGIVPATKLAMTRALEHLSIQFPDFVADCLFLDSMPWPEAPVACRLVSILKGDQHSLSIAAASVLAKTWRDEHMNDLEKQHPGYDLGVHKGYGTAKHQAALKSLGVCGVHRMSYKPVRDAMNPSEA